MQEYLKRLKDQSKMSAKEIANKSGIPEATISRILSGQTEDPYFSNISAIVIAMGGSLDELCGITKTSDPMIDFYEKTLNFERKRIKTLSVILLVIVAVIVAILIYDAFHGNIGYIRY